MSGIEITPIRAAGVNLIRSYGDGGFTIGTETHHNGSVIVFAKSTVDWTPKTVEMITIKSLNPVLNSPDPIDILVLGCGRIQLTPPKELRDGLREYGIVLEWMNTGAACRTFNVLLGEERRVASALIAV